MSLLIHIRICLDICTTIQIRLNHGIGLCLTRYFINIFNPTATFWTLNQSSWNWNPFWSEIFPPSFNCANLPIVNDDRVLHTFLENMPVWISWFSKEKSWTFWPWHLGTPIWFIEMNGRVITLYQFSRVSKTKPLVQSLVFNFYKYCWRPNTDKSWFQPNFTS